MKIICLPDGNNTHYNNDQMISFLLASNLLDGFASKGCMKQEHNPYLTAGAINLLWTKADQL